MLLRLFLLGCLACLAGCIKVPDIDGVELARLAKLGISLSEPYPFYFQAVFSKRESAEKAAAFLKEKGYYEIMVNKLDEGALEGGFWLRASKVLIPGTQLPSFYEEFQRSMESLGSGSRGWGCNVTASR